jgi:K+-transporting ATPase ATPase C chain
VLDDAGNPVEDEEGNEVREPNVVYFQPRPSQTGYNAAASGFLNQAPNDQALADLLAERLAAYLELEGEYTDDLDKADVPVDAVANSASGLDPHISIANARIQANRIAETRDADLEDVLELVDDNTTSRAFGIFGQRGVNVLELNLDLDEEYPVR